LLADSAVIESAIRDHLEEGLAQDGPDTIWQTFSALAPGVRQRLCKAAFLSAVRDTVARVRGDRGVARTPDLALIDRILAAVAERVTRRGGRAVFVDVPDVEELQDRPSCPALACRIRRARDAA
jgi:hypothetical protein